MIDGYEASLIVSRLIFIATILELELRPVAC
jgi:hypothetical protein